MNDQYVMHSREGETGERAGEGERQMERDKERERDMQRQIFQHFSGISTSMDKVGIYTN